MGIVHSDIQEVCRSSGILTALMLKFARAWWGPIALLASYLMLTLIETLHLVIFLVKMHGRIRNCLVRACSRIQRLLSNFVRFFCGRYSSGCIEDAKKRSPMEKNSRKTSYYILQKRWCM